MEGQKKKIRIVAMSDTHDLHFRINVQELPPADIFIHSGDFTKFSTTAELARFRQFLGLLPYKHKVVIAGNHDFGLDRVAYKTYRTTKHKNTPIDTEEEIAKLKKVCTYLQHQSVEVQGLKIFGSPYSLQFYDWGFMYKAQDAEKLWSVIPHDTDILITHGPPLGILDKTINNFQAGCKSLGQYVFKIKPQAHIFGHIHQAYGQKQIDGIHFYNASTVNVFYKIVNPPIVFDVVSKK